MTYSTKRVQAIDKKPHFTQWNAVVFPEMFCDFVVTLKGQIRFKQKSAHLYNF